MITSSVSLRSRFPHARALLEEALARAVAETGRKIAEEARANMTPGHFLDTGLSQEETRWEQLTPTGGQVHIPTAYAAHAEFGTTHMAPRPVLRPAIDQTWPASLHNSWGAALRGLSSGPGMHVLPEIDPPQPAGPVLDHKGARP